jgi:hypothetical protein
LESFLRKICSRLASLLAKFRIEYADLVIITDVMTKAKESTREYFDGLLKEYKKTNDDIMDEGKYDLFMYPNNNLFASQLKSNLIYMCVVCAHVRFV